MSDLIDRQAAIDMFQNLAYDDWNQGASTTWADAYSEAAEMIRDLPSAQPEQQWIPCNERLPDRVGFYWTTAVGGSGTRTMTSRFFDGTKWERKRRDYTKVVAWMPLPEPYKEDE